MVIVGRAVISAAVVISKVMILSLAASVRPGRQSAAGSRQAVIL
ncbi:hypothetical protein J2X68_003283 [Streptomyces sp. 3330]|nr:hypothetical protein [Streptomyces sp. 3330]MDR6976592.1 hypothetical protein [Streptomyces sp. 3330]